MTKNEDKVDSIAKNVQTLTFLIIFLLVAVGILFVKDFVKKPQSGNVKAIEDQQTSPQQEPQTAQVSLDQIKKLFVKDNIYFGNKNSKNLFVMVSDPSCPYCQIAAGENPELNNQSGSQFVLEQDGGTYLAPVIKMRELVDQGKAAFVWLYKNGHNNGEMATKALYCANDQNKFWEAHDLLMSNDGYNLINEVVQNNQDKTPELVSFLSSAVNTEKLEKCLNNGKYDDKLNKDMSIAESLGVNGTPGFFVNTTNFAGAYSWSEMESAVK